MLLVVLMLLVYILQFLMQLFLDLCIHAVQLLYHQYNLLFFQIFCPRRPGPGYRAQLTRGSRVLLLSVLAESSLSQIQTDTDESASLQERRV